MDSNSHSGILLNHSSTFPIYALQTVSYCNLTKKNHALTIFLKKNIVKLVGIKVAVIVLMNSNSISAYIYLFWPLKLDGPTQAMFRWVSTYLPIYLCLELCKSWRLYFNLNHNAKVPLENDSFVGFTFWRLERPRT